MAQEQLGTNIFGSESAKAWLTMYLADDAAAASNRLTSALRQVAETGDDLDPDEAAAGRAAVAILLAESAPEVLDGAPAELSAKVAELDTELTPARRSFAQGVVRRLLLDQENSWLTSLGETDRAAAVAATERLGALLENT